MAYCGYVTTLKNVRPHPNADRMKLADCFGNTVCVGLDVKEDEIILYFPTDGQLSVEYCEQNNLVRKKDEAGNNVGGYLDPDKRNVKAIKLRGEKSDGIVMPLSSLEYTGISVSDLKIGDPITVINSHEICCKYIPRTNPHRSHYSSGNKTRKAKVDVSPLFNEHADTEQLAYNLGAFKTGDYIEITLKMHGTSQRTAHLPVLKKFKRAFIDWLNRRQGTPIYDWGYVSGTRRVVLSDYEGGFYGSNSFREPHSKVFEGKLHKGEEVFYEVVGFTDTGAPIMANGNNEKLGKDFVKQYGKETVFSYGCSPDGIALVEYDDMITGTSVYEESRPQSDIYVYRMTMTNEDGEVVEYTPDFMRYRCEQMGVKTVPVLWSGFIPENPATKDDPTVSAGEWVAAKVEQYYDGPDPIGKTHIREGVVVRIINRPKFCAYKHKNHSFKMISGIIAETIADSNVEINEDILAEL